MRKFISKTLFMVIASSLLLNLFGCAALKKKFTRKKKSKPREELFTPVKEYDVKPSIDLYQKHYIYWFNWHKKLVVELGGNFKSDIKCVEEMIANLGDMTTLLVDEKAGELFSHIRELKKIEDVLSKRNMSGGKKTRLKRVLEREYRAINRGFSPKKMKGYIREDWKEKKT